MFSYDPKKRQRGTGFTNIQKILQANVGAGQQMAGDIAQGIESAGQNVQQQLGKAQQKFKTGFQEAMSPISKTSGIASGFARKPGESVDEYSKRISESGDIDYAKIGQNVRDIKYGGPTELEGYKNILGAGIGASRLAGYAGSEAGQRLLAGKFLGAGKGYSRGQSAFDQFLLGQSAQAQQALQKARQSISNIPGQILSAGELAKNLASGMETGLEEEKAKIGKDIQRSIGEVEETGKRAGEQYSKEAARLQYLLQNIDKLDDIKGKTTTERGTLFDPKQAQMDERLLMDAANNPEKFGLDPSAKIFTLGPKQELGKEDEKGEPTAAGLIFQELANKANVQFGSKYSDAQKAALQKLAKFQGDEDKASQIAAQKDKRMFAMSPEDVKNLAKMQEYEADKQEKMKMTTSDIGDLEKALEEYNPAPWSFIRQGEGETNQEFQERKRRAELLNKAIPKDIMQRIFEEADARVQDDPLSGGYGDPVGPINIPKIDSELMKKLVSEYMIKNVIDPKKKTVEDLSRYDYGQKSISDFLNQYLNKNKEKKE